MQIREKESYYWRMETRKKWWGWAKQKRRGKKRNEQGFLNWGRFWSGRAWTGYQNASEGGEKVQKMRGRGWGGVGNRKKR